MAQPSDSLRSRLAYEPRDLSFGTSGRRGEVEHLTQLEVYIDVLAELTYLQSIPVEEGGIVPREEFYFAYDLRPSSSGFVAEGGRRGEICQAVERAAMDAGMQPVNLGRIPTPALAYFAFSHGKGSIMVTGSHIPFDQNGYKLNTSHGELLKKHEVPISEAVKRVRERIFEQRFTESIFDERGMFKEGHRDLTAERDDARSMYVRRYLDFFDGSSLANRCVVVYQHSAVGRDILVEILVSLGAEVIPMGRSDTFVPIDTENVDAAQTARLQMLLDEAAQRFGPIWALVSTDGDSDRPLIVGVDSHSAVRFFGGDLAGMIAAEYLGADSVVVPISCNDGIDRGTLAPALEPKTRIGSPYVIAGLEKAREKGRRVICGWEANGGFLTASDIERHGRSLRQLCTRDAILPILCVLFAAHRRNASLDELFSRLPKRFSRAALIKEFPRAAGRKLVEEFSLGDLAIQDVVFDAVGTKFYDGRGTECETSRGLALRAETVRSQLHEFFGASHGFGRIVRLNYVDGVRIAFDNGDVAHFRPSGNADELRIYAVADTQERADSIAHMAVAEPDGMFRLLERFVFGRGSESSV